jgi:hypothetical protein
MTPQQQDAILKLGRNPLLAHQALFGHRHPNTTPAFHVDIIKAWHGSAPGVLVMAFRESGKSTIAEEAFVIGAGYQLFHNALIIGATERRACERLRAIKHEIENNELVELLFGRLQGHVWNEAEIIMSNGTRIVAVGRGQSLRGTKHLHFRPDFCFCDDIEDEEHVRTPEARDETLKWFMSVVMPALDIKARIRVTATPLDREALPFALKNKLKWPSKVYPIEYVDKEGKRAATWPARYPLPWIDNKRREFAAVGKLEEYMREYMCIAEDPKAKVFRSSMFSGVVRPQVRTWHPTYAFFDPARTTGTTARNKGERTGLYKSATTGWAVWSWIANRLIVWDAGGDYWKPDEIIRRIFKVNADYAPVMIGVEQDGLHEFLLQPLRTEMVRRSTIVPVKATKAPKGKYTFIEGLQPFFNARDVVFAKDLPELQRQFLNFPTGRIDAPNALAYALILRPGIVIYEEFGSGNVIPEVRVRESVPCYLCLNAGSGFTTGVLAQFHKGTVSIIADFVYEADPTACVDALVKEASLEAAEKLVLVAPVEHFGAFNHLGLRGAVAKLPAELRKGGLCEVGRGQVRELLSKQVNAAPALQVSMKARWTLNGFAAGYAKEIDRVGLVKDDARVGLYRVLMEGLESFAALLKSGITGEDRPNYQRTASGQLYISALPGQGVPDAKDALLSPSSLGVPR